MSTASLFLLAAACYERCPKRKRASSKLMTDCAKVRPIREDCRVYHAMKTYASQAGVSEGDIVKKVEEVMEAMEADRDCGRALYKVVDEYMESAQRIVGEVLKTFAVLFRSCIAGSVAVPIILRDSALLDSIAARYSSFGEGKLLGLEEAVHKLQRELAPKNKRKATSCDVMDEVAGAKAEIEEGSEEEKRDSSIQVSPRKRVRSKKGEAASATVTASDDGEVLVEDGLLRLQLGQGSRGGDDAEFAARPGAAAAGVIDSGADLLKHNPTAQGGRAAVSAAASSNGTGSSTSTSIVCGDPKAAQPCSARRKKKNMGPEPSDTRSSSADAVIAPATRMCAQAAVQADSAVVLDRDDPVLFTAHSA